jgi:acetyl esterase/lipase
MKLVRRTLLLAALLIAWPAPAAEPAVEPADVDFTPGELEVRKHFSADAVRLTTIRLWPGKAPDEPRPIPAESLGDGKQQGRIHAVTEPSITVVQAKNGDAPPNSVAATNPAVLVCPGGGYGSLGIESGGVDVIRWLNEIGISGVYLKYRVPKRHADFPMHHQPLQDIQRAMSLVRSRAADLHIDPKRIGVIGFSAGGNLAAMLATHHRKEDRLYPPVDEADSTSCRPDFVLMVAPAYLTVPILSAALDPQLQLDKVARNLTPSMFITSATTDKFSVGACHFALALREQHVPVELHLYEKGGHAEGIHAGPDNQWPSMAADWMRRSGILRPANDNPQPAPRQ